MSRPSKFSPEVQERAVRMVEESRGEHESQWAAIRSVQPADCGFVIADIVVWPLQKI